MPNRYDFTKLMAIYGRGTAATGSSGSGSGSSPAAASRTLQMAQPSAQSPVVQILDDSQDGTTVLAPATALDTVTLALPKAGLNLQQHIVVSMKDIASITFTDGAVLNPPAELLANQAITIERIDQTNNTWITV